MAAGQLLPLFYVFFRLFLTLGGVRLGFLAALLERANFLFFLLGLLPACLQAALKLRLLFF